MAFLIGICDDEINMTNYVEELVMKWKETRHIDVLINKFNSVESFLFHYDEDKSYNLLLLDIEMGKENGVALAKKIRKNNESVDIVFITGYTDYIAEGYDVRALHYLMKPLDINKFFTVLDRAYINQKQNEKSLNVEIHGVFHRIPLYEIKYLDVNRNYVSIHAKEDYVLKSTLAQFEDKLDKNFYRASRSLIVNLKCIKKVSKSEIFLSSGEILTLPKDQYEKLNQAIIAHT